MIHAMTELKYMVNSSDFENAGNVSQDLKKKLTEMNIVMSIVKLLKLQNTKTAGPEKPLVSQQLPFSLEQLPVV